MPYSPRLRLYKTNPQPSIKKKNILGTVFIGSSCFYFKWGPDSSERFGLRVQIFLKYMYMDWGGGGVPNGGGPNCHDRLLQTWLNA